MTSRRILLLTPQLPDPAGQGAAIRNWNLCVELGKRHELDLLSFNAPNAGAATIPRGGVPWRNVVTVPPPRRTLARRLRTLLVTRQADMADRLWSPPFRDAFNRALADAGYDIVQAEGIELGRYLLARPSGATDAPLFAFDDHNAEYQLQHRAARAALGQPRRWPLATYSLVQSRRLRALEYGVLRRCELSFCVSEEDAAALRRLTPRTVPIVAPNGVDTTYYAPRPASPELGPIDILFSGTLDYRPNVDAIAWFTERVWPALQARRPGLTAVLLGRSPSPEVRRLAARSGFTVTGAVRDDRPYIASATVYVLPMRFGGGSRLKLLNALAMGRAVVTTSAGREGTELEAGTHVLLADEAAAFAASIERLLDDAPLRMRLGAAGRDYVHQYHNWVASAARMDAAYEQAMARRMGGGAER